MFRVIVALFCSAACGVFAVAAEPAAAVAPAADERAIVRQISEDLMQAVAGRDSAPPVGELIDAIDRLGREYPDNTNLGALAYLVFVVLDRTAPAGIAGALDRFMSSPNASLRELAAGRRELERLRTAPMELRFTALDGREVDLAKLRGKVVLVDFWATWCGPCIAELPNVKAVYEKYHARGFEVVGISLDRAQDREKFAALVKKHELPWPQLFDGQAWNNELARRFGIRAIPAMLLLDQSGRLAVTEARGEKLEAEVKRLLEK